MNRVKTRIPWIWAGLVAVASLAVFLTGDFNADGFSSVVSEAGWLLLPTLYSALGALLATRQPGNRITWILFSVAVGVLLDGAAQSFIQTAPATPTAIDYLALFLANFMWVVIFFPLFLLLHLFPTGRFLTRRWAWAGWLTAAMVVVMLVVGGFAETFGPPEREWVIDNPIGFVPNSVLDGVFGVAWSLGLIVLPLGGFAAMATRFRRSHLVERTQIKWVLYAGLMLALVYAGSVVASELGSSDGGALVGNIFVFSLALLPVSITAAITRYRLFEIDRVISRTLSYSVVVVVLGGLYLGIVTLVAAMLPTQNAISVAGSTLAVAVLFNPVRKRIQRGVDKRFNRSGYQAEIILQDLSTDLRESLSVEELTKALDSTVNDAFSPGFTGIWLNQT